MIKKCVTHEEWEELKEYQKDVLRRRYGYELYSSDQRDTPIYMNIGRMIDFLGEDWWQSYVKIKYTWVAEDRDLYYQLCDELWHDVKKKLSNYEQAT